jgi:hypothetical protein
MKDHDMVVRLRDLRRLREQRAKETVMRREKVAKQAAAVTQEASSAVATHFQQTAEEERSAFGLLLGQSVTAASLRSIQRQFEKAAGEAARLRENERTASAAEQKHKAELSGARDTHRIRLKAVAKLDELLGQLTRRTARRRMALAELCDEDDRGPARPRTLASL